LCYIILRTAVPPAGGGRRGDQPSDHVREDSPGLLVPLQAAIHQFLIRVSHACAPPLRAYSPIRRHRSSAEKVGDRRVGVVGGARREAQPRQRLELGIVGQDDRRPTA
jgi:hypothetical protein